MSALLSPDSDGLLFGAVRQFKELKLALNMKTCCMQRIDAASVPASPGGGALRAGRAPRGAGRRR